MPGFSQPQTGASLPYLRQASQGSSVTKSTGNYNPSSGQTGGKTGAQKALFRATADPTKNNALLNPQTTFDNLYQRSTPNVGTTSMGGIVTANLPNGQTLQIPNALAQKLQKTQDYNQGRYNQSEYFGYTGKEQQTPETKYQDYGAAQGRINTFLQQNQQYQNPGAVNQYQAKIDRYQELDNQIQNLNSQLTGMTQRESVDTRGNLINPTDTTSNSYSNLKNQIEAAKRARGSGQITPQDRRGANEADNIMDKLQGLRATTSNLQIKETRVA